MLAEALVASFPAAVVTVLVATRTGLLRAARQILDAMRTARQQFRRDFADEDARDAALMATALALLAASGAVALRVLATAVAFLATFLPIGRALTGNFGATLGTLADPLVQLLLLPLFAVVLWVSRRAGL